MPRRKKVPFTVQKTGIVTLKLELKIPLTMEAKIISKYESIKLVGGTWCRIGEYETLQLLEIISWVYINEFRPQEPSGKVFFKFEE